MRKLIYFVMIPFLAACRRDDMQSYRVPKEPSPFMATGEGGGDPVPSGELPPGHPATGMDIQGAAAAGIAPEPAPEGKVSWTVPRGWTEKPGSGFRYVTFEVPGKGGLIGDLSVTVLKGEAGGLLGNVNRWRGQVGLGPVSEGELVSQSRKIKPAGRPMTLVSFVSPDRRLEGKYRQRLMAAVFPASENTWFFKLVGEDGLVRSAEPDFLKFLESLTGL
jgi:hypothetical protein